MGTFLFGNITATVIIINADFIDVHEMETV